MKFYKILPAIFAVAAFFISCKKEKHLDSCATETAIVRQIDRDSATIKLSDGSYYIFEDGTIDERLLPCSLSGEFRIDNLRVMISGNVKETVQVSGSTCCLAYFEITSITK